eukprot:661648-Amorphochlora_amoeboformis.AAC.1
MVRIVAAVPQMLSYSAANYFTWILMDIRVDLPKVRTQKCHKRNQNWKPAIRQSEWNVSESDY